MTDGRSEKNSSEKMDGRRVAQDGILRYTLAIASVFIIVLACLGALAHQQGKEKRRAARAVARGQEVFLRYCGPCHGPTGQGDGKFFATGLEPKPIDLSDESYLRTRTDAELFQWIREGSSAAGRSLLCPPWGKTLDEEQIRELVAFIRTLASNAKGEESAPPK